LTLVHERAAVALDEIRAIVDAKPGYTTATSPGPADRSRAAANLAASFRPAMSTRRIAASPAA
jgi:hypothetical protein